MDRPIDPNEEPWESAIGRIIASINIFTKKPKITKVNCAILSHKTLRRKLAQYQQHGGRGGGRGGLCARFMRHIHARVRRRSRRRLLARPIPHHAWSGTASMLASVGALLS